MEVAETAQRRTGTRATVGTVVGTWGASAGVAGSFLVLCAATDSSWPAAALPALIAAVALVPLSGTATALAVAPLVAATIAVALSSIGRGELVAAAGLGAAVLLGVLVAVVVVIFRHRAIAELDAARQLADAVSVVDEATGCYNANGLDLLARHVLGAARRSSGAMHASLVQLGDLEPVRELGGPQAVAEVIGGVADALRASTRGADVVGRWGEDLFVVLGPGTGTTPAELERRLRVRLLGSPDAPLVRWACSLTVGSGLLEPWDSGGLAELVSRAEQDLALRRALRAPSAVEPARQRPSRRSEDQPGSIG
ncbi:GGDEF domain-containing protein, diguanylate cyclase (c-di-GMP synthetase) or its enzymatically inactive variants [Quadrisphaera granulorum]|uniref:GGDEF domain-containing protein n=1 Tax=Quadrisphaera granulorum TaxID=317664 RepID=A0A316AAX6_9ACTN|nr:GGDEF domain-containing protein [Quadrisphaera granulorum]SZE96461.1 GGDEF domain-containing protein, diguanylate cyclase (c-di-GMP synthetase) or its enzymatically inactive variants [Quadrisphaera granulorum]